MNKLQIIKLNKYLETIGQQCGDNSVVLEIGAHIGQDTERIYNNFPDTVKLFTFEPDPRNIEVLKLNDFYKEKKIPIIEKAIGDKDGTTSFHLSGGLTQKGKLFTAGSSLHPPTKILEELRKWRKVAAVIEINICTLDTFFNEYSLDHIDFIWADVQGAEADLIRGGERALKNTKYLFTEYGKNEHFEGQKTLEELCKMLPYWKIIEVFPDDVLLKNTKYNK
jgi:FkbM family methyltransferase